MIKTGVSSFLSFQAFFEPFFEPFFEESNQSWLPFLSQLLMMTCNKSTTVLQWTTVLTTNSRSVAVEEGVSGDILD